MTTENDNSKNQMPLTEYEKRQVALIEEWKHKEPDVISRFSDSILAPVNWIVSQVIPESAMLGALNLGNAAGEILSRVQTIRSCEISLMKPDWKPVCGA